MQNFMLIPKNIGPEILRLSVFELHGLPDLVLQFSINFEAKFWN